MSKVWPVEGNYISGIPAAEHECSGKGEHANCIKSGAFTDKPPKADKTKAPENPEPAEPTEE